MPLSLSANTSQALRAIEISIPCSDKNNRQDLAKAFRKLDTTFNKYYQSCASTEQIAQNKCFQHCEGHFILGMEEIGEHACILKLIPRSEEGTPFSESSKAEHVKLNSHLSDQHKLSNTLLTEMQVPHSARIIARTLYDEKKWYQKQSKIDRINQQDDISMLHYTNSLLESLKTQYSNPVELHTIFSQQKLNDTDYPSKSSHHSPRRTEDHLSAGLALLTLCIFTQT